MAKKTYLILWALFALLFTCYHYLSKNKQYENHSHTSVYIQYKNGQYTLIRNGKPFIIKGASGHTQLKKLKELGGNTIRTYDTVNLTNILNEAEVNDIAVVAGLYMPESAYTTHYYDDTAWVSKNFAAMKTIVNKYKHSPALLMWCVGNELYFPLSSRYKNFYTAYNQVVDMIHDTDPDHPVTTAMVNFDIKNILTIKHRTNVDIISFNIFYGQIKNLKNQLRQYSWLWNDPYMLGEWGNDGPWVERGTTAWMAPLELTSNQKADELIQTYQQYISRNDKRLLGTFAFYWGYKQEKTHTWFSFFDEKGAASAMTGALQYIWTGQKSSAVFPQIEKILLDTMGVFDNPLYAPNMKVTSKVTLRNNDEVEFIYKWSLYQEDWHKRGENINNERFLQPFPDGWINSQNGNSIVFKTPSTEGPYRLFVNVYSRDGTFSSCNIPFYVIAKQ